MNCIGKLDIFYKYPNALAPSRWDHSNGDHCCTVGTQRAFEKKWPFTIVKLSFWIDRKWHVESLRSFFFKQSVIKSLVDNEKTEKRITRNIIWEQVRSRKFREKLNTNMRGMFPGLLHVDNRPTRCYLVSVSGHAIGTRKKEQCLMTS